MRIEVAYLQQRGGALHYRRRVPTDLKHILGKREWTHALGLSVGQETKAAQIIAKVNERYEKLIAETRAGIISEPNTPVVPARDVSSDQEAVGQLATLLSHALQKAVAGLGNSAVSQNTTTASTTLPESEVRTEGQTISQVYEEDLKTYGGVRDEKPIGVAVDSFIKHLGDLKISEISPKDVQGWIRITFEQDNHSPATVTRRVAAVRAVINRYLRDNEIERRNPFSNAQIRQGRSTNTDRLPFNKKHLDLIDRYLKHGPQLTDESKNILTLIKFTGARPLEIGGLEVSDVFLDHDVPHIWIRNNKIRSLKTKGSERRIPLVGDALAAAQAAVGAAAEKTALFSNGCHKTNSLSQRLNKIIRRARVPKSKRLVVYSFRHSIEEAMRTAELPLHTQKRIMGHDDGSITGRYGAPVGMLEDLQKSLSQAVSMLGKVDDVIYSKAEVV